MNITIHDTGVGITKETVSEVFEKFVRAKNANCVNMTDIGLGLYVAKKMVVDMGEHVRGTCTTGVLPFFGRLHLLKIWSRKTH